MEYVTIHPNDTVKVCLQDGHKYARRAIHKGQPVIKYGFPIGIATADIAPGERVHCHNLRTALGGARDYSYTPKFQYPAPLSQATIDGFARPGGQVGIRNDIWIVPTVGCVNSIARALADRTDAIALTHPYGCSQLGDDLAVTQKVLAGLVHHPNAGGVLVLGLGCENNNIPEFKKILGDWDSRRVRFLNCQDCTDELEKGVTIIRELQALAAKDQRCALPVSKLKIGLKCGGSDGLSGITANPLCGRVTDRLAAMGGSAVLTEVPEMFGAETILMNRSESKAVFEKTVHLINDFKSYFIENKQPIYENPSPGNKAGGISTLEEKSLGCTQKAGTSAVRDVMLYGERLKTKGLNLLSAPGNDLVASTALASSGCHLVLFTTGRGTPFGTFVPTVKVSTNSNLNARKPNWIDFNAGSLLEGESMEELRERFIRFIIGIASGNPTNNEKNDYREIAIFKSGVTL